MGNGPPCIAPLHPLNLSTQAHPQPLVALTPPTICPPHSLTRYPSRRHALTLKPCRRRRLVCASTSTSQIARPSCDKMFSFNSGGARRPGLHLPTLPSFLSLAQVCSDINKPNGHFILPSDRDAIAAFLKPLRRGGSGPCESWGLACIGEGGGRRGRGQERKRAGRSLCQVDCCAKCILPPRSHSLSSAHLLPHPTYSVHPGHASLRKRTPTPSPACASQSPASRPSPPASARSAASARWPNVCYPRLSARRHVAISWNTARL